MLLYVRFFSFKVYIRLVDIKSLFAVTPFISYQHPGFFTSSNFPTANSKGIPTVQTKNKDLKLPVSLINILDI